MNIDNFVDFSELCVSHTFLGGCNMVNSAKDLAMAGAELDRIKS